mmetsp:Transcript_73233/g.197319  ORF Transcript_73233/g.197319 Transcript_73233/m.197319 type:complete len:383 (-) Transcript_73233:204-1352(-)
MAGLCCEAAVRPNVADTQHDLRRLQQALLLLPDDAHASLRRSKLQGLGLLASHQLALVEDLSAGPRETLGHRWQDLAPDRRQEAPQILHTQAVHEESANYLVSFQWHRVGSATFWKLLDGGPQLLAACPVQLPRRQGRVVGGHGHHSHNLLGAAAEKLGQARGRHDALHEQRPHQVLVDPEAERRISAAAHQEKRPLRVDGQAIHVRVVLVADVQAPPCGHVPDSNCRVPRAAEEYERQLAVPQQTPDVVRVAHQSPDLARACEARVAVPYPDGLVVAPGRDQIGAHWVVGDVEDAGSVTLQNDLWFAIRATLAICEVEDPDSAILARSGQDPVLLRVPFHTDNGARVRNLSDQVPRGRIRHASEAVGTARGDLPGARVAPP